jgi:hypothetical protein
MEIPVSDRNSAQVHHGEPPAGEPPRVPIDPAGSKYRVIRASSKHT